MMRSPYKYADEEIVLLQREINAEFHNESLTPWDELNVIKVRKRSDDLYKRLQRYHRRTCERVADRAYYDAIALAVEAGYALPSKRKKSHSAAAIVAALFLMYSGVTEYQFQREAQRKRDRLADGMLSAESRLALINALNVGAKNWYRQARQYIDMSVDEGMMAGFSDAGVEKVRWVTERDEKVCSRCKELDGKIFPLAEVPTKPHPNCRCHLVPVSRVTDP